MSFVSQKNWQLVAKKMGREKHLKGEPEHLSWSPANHSRGYEPTPER